MTGSRWWGVTGSRPPAWTTVPPALTGGFTVLLQTTAYEKALA